MAFLVAGTVHSGGLKKSNETLRLVMTAIFGIVLGFFVGVSFPQVYFTRFGFPSRVMIADTINVESGENSYSGSATQVLLHSTHASQQKSNISSPSTAPTSGNSSEIYVPTNPRGAEMLAPGIVEAETDFYLRRLWGKPSEDLPFKQKYLAVFTVGLAQKDTVNNEISKFSENFTIVLFHYDGRTSEWDQFEWSKQAVHISVRRQTKWWYAKRFLHPDVVASYEYIFIWDEDLGVEHFNAEEYLKLVRKHGLEISQPALEPNNRGPTWQMTKRRGDVEVHKNTTEKPGWCHDPNLPPCAGFVEIMAPVFSRKAWRCVWYMIQNDLVHGWGLDLAIKRCAEPAHEKIGVVDAQWIVHKGVPSLGNEGSSEGGKAPWEGVRERCKEEWRDFRLRLEKAEKEYLQGNS